MSANGINRLYLPRDLTANLHQELAIERLRAEEGLPPQVRKSERMEVLTFLTERPLWLLLCQFVPQYTPEYLEKEAAV